MANSTGLSFFQRLFSSLFSGNDQEAEKRRLLKAISKNLSRTGYKFYKQSSDQILPAFGKFFYDTYKLLSQAQVFFQGQPNPNYYKNIVIDACQSENQKQISESLTEESIMMASKSMPFDQLKAKIKADTDAYMSEFDMDKITKTDALYTKLLGFKALCLYDYYFMLKKFDSSIKEGDFNRSPKLEPIDAAYVADDLKDFLSIVYSLPLDDDWSDLMALFKTTKGVEPVKPGQWNKLVSKFRQMRDNRVFDMIIQLITKDPSYATDVALKQEHVVEPFLESIKNQTSQTLRKLENDQKNSRIDSLLVQIFNTNAVVILKNYTEQNSSTYEKRNLGKFDYARALNYMKAFLIEFVKRDVREYSDLVLIRGKWTTIPVSNQMSDDYHMLLDLSDTITSFDDKMNEEAEIGSKLKTLLPRADRDREANNIIHTTLKDVNSVAKEYLVNGTKAMISYAKTLKMLIEDHQKPKGELVMNWKELDRYAEHPVHQLGVEVYKKIYLFVNLMQGLL